MNVDELLTSLKQVMPKVSTSYCVVNGAIMPLSEVEKMGCKDFWIRTKLSVPSKLYKYFPNTPKMVDGEEINYSIQALRNNTVFMQTPNEFDDVYDSDINIDYLKYERLRLTEYCRRCKIEIQDSLSTVEIGNLLIQALAKSMNTLGSFEHIFNVELCSENERLSNKLFCLKLVQETNESHDLGIALAKVIRSDYEEYCSRLKNTFRTSCFATTPYSQLMWGGSYADCHRGFCIEYPVLPTDNRYKEIYLNLFPMIYCKTRPNMTERITKLQDKEITMDVLWDIYFHGALRKSIDWAFQNEWRLLLPMGRKNPSDFNIEFFPITKVFLGNRMHPMKRREVIEICKDRGIPYVGVMRNPDLFEMQDCSIKCDDCIKFKDGLETENSKK